MAEPVFFAGGSELATLTNTFLVNNVATDPTTVTLTITTPSQVATSYTYAAAQITKASTGVYTKDIDVSGEAGMWTADWIGTGTASDHQTVTFQVFETALGHLYATIDSLKSRLSIPASDTADDFELHGACFAASRAIEQMCGRVFYKSAAAEARTFIPQEWPRGMLVLKLPDFNDLLSVTALATDSSGDGVFETTWQTTDYQLRPSNTSGPEARPYTEVKAIGAQVFPPLYGWLARDDRVQITGIWGWTTVPAAIRQAALLAAAQLFKMKDAPLGVAGFGDLGIVRVQAMPMVAQLVGPYMRHPVLVG